MVKLLSHNWRQYATVENFEPKKTQQLLLLLLNQLKTHGNVYSNQNFYIEHKYTIRLVPAQDIHFFYTCSHLSALQNCALLFSTNFQFIFIFKNALHNLVSELCSAPFFKNILQVFIKFTHSFVAIELLTLCKKAIKLFYCSRELSPFWLNK